MKVTTNPTIKVITNVHAPVQKVWESWTTPEHITQWNAATREWHTPKAENDLRVGGALKYRMESKDGSMGFDFEGVYTSVEPYSYMAYTIADGRKVQVHFKETGNVTAIEEIFEAESTHSLDMQQMGWQAILNNFKDYTEALL